MIVVWWVVVAAGTGNDCRCEQLESESVVSG